MKKDLALLIGLEKTLLNNVQKHVATGRLLLTVHVCQALMVKCVVVVFAGIVGTSVSITSCHRHLYISISHGMQSTRRGLYTCACSGQKAHADITNFRLVDS